MAVNLSPLGGVGQQFFTNNGVLLAGGTINTYLAGTTTNAATYTSSSGTIAQANPIVLNSAGRVPSGEIWLTDGISYKFVISDASGNLIGTYDNLVGINSNFLSFTNSQEIQTATAGQTVFTLTTMQYLPGTNSLSVFVDGVDQYGPSGTYAYTETSSTVVTFTSGLHKGALVKFTTSQTQNASVTNASQIEYDPGGTGAVATNVQAKLRQTISVLDFGADPTNGTDSTQAIQDALDYVANYPSAYCPSKSSGGAGEVYILFPRGSYFVSSVLVANQRGWQYLIGEGRVTIYSSSPTYIIDMASCWRCGIENIDFVSTTAGVGIYMNRATSNPFCDYNSFTNVNIDVGTNTSANSNIGTIAVYMNRVEQNIFENCAFIADCDVYNDDAFNSLFPVTNGTQDSTTNSNTVNTFNECNFSKQGEHQFAIRLVGALGFRFNNCFFKDLGVTTGSNPYIFQMDSCTDCVFQGSCEGSSLRFAAIIGNNYSHNFDIVLSGPVINTCVFNFDTAGSNALKQSTIKVMTGGSSSGMYLFYQSSSSATASVIGNQVICRSDITVSAGSNMYYYGNVTITENYLTDNAQFGYLTTYGALTSFEQTAPVSGGTNLAGLFVSSTQNLGVIVGSGAPNVSAAQGTLYLRTDGSSTNNRMYINTSTGNNWTAVITAS